MQDRRCVFWFRGHIFNNSQLAILDISVEHYKDLQFLVCQCIYCFVPWFEEQYADDIKLHLISRAWYKFGQISKLGFLYTCLNPNHMLSYMILEHHTDSAFLRKCCCWFSNFLMVLTVSNQQNVQEKNNYGDKTALEHIESDIRSNHHDLPSEQSKRIQQQPCQKRCQQILRPGGAPPPVSQLRATDLQLWTSLQLWLLQLFVPWRCRITNP